MATSESHQRVGQENNSADGLGQDGTSLRTLLGLALYRLQEAQRRQAASGESGTVCVATQDIKRWGLVVTDLLVKEPTFASFAKANTWRVQLQKHHGNTQEDIDPAIIDVLAYVWPYLQRMELYPEETILRRIIDRARDLMDTEFWNIYTKAPRSLIGTDLNIELPDQRAVDAAEEVIAQEELSIRGVYIDDLDPQERRLFELRCIEQRPYNEIAKIWGAGYTPEALRKHYQRIKGVMTDWQTDIELVCNHSLEWSLFISSIKKNEERCLLEDRFRQYPPPRFKIIADSLPGSPWNPQDIRSLYRRLMRRFRNQIGIPYPYHY